MTTTLRVIRLKPNPVGKDRNRYGRADPAQLGAEWVDIKNTGYATANLAGVELNHLAYSRGDPKPRWQAIVTLSGDLRPGNVLRVHSGQTRPISVLRPEDISGADYHSFTGKDAYVWNNREGDAAGLWSLPGKTWIDRAHYDPFPPEGVILVRSGDRLVAAQGAAYRS